MGLVGYVFLERFYSDDLTATVNHCVPEGHKSILQVYQVFALKRVEVK